MIRNRKVLNQRLRVVIQVGRQIQNLKSWKILVILIVLTGILILPSAISSLMNKVIINSFGQISTTTVWAKSGYWRDVQDAVNLAVRLGIANVRIPEGTYNFVNIDESWTGARVRVPAGISIFGAPTERYANSSVIEWKTVLVMPWDMPGGDPSIPIWFQFGSGYSVGYNSRFSDIKLVGYRYYNSSSTYMHRGVVMTRILNFRVDHCCFQDISGGGVQAKGSSNTEMPESYYWIRGVIDHCIFNNTVGVVAPYDDRTVDYGIQISRGSGYQNQYWDTNIQTILGYYTNYTVFVEDCYFEKWRHCVAVNTGAHAVVRYCTIKDDYAYGSIDIHGSPGGRAIEIYNCTIIDAVSGGAGQVYATFIRGGSGVAFNNIVGGGAYTTFVYLSDENPNSTMWIQDWYIWNNTMLANCREIVEYDPDNNIREGVDYFRYAPSWYLSYSYPHPLTLRVTP